MTIEALACEVQFLDHLAPVWRALPPAIRGRFLVDQTLLERARLAGVDAEPIDAMALRSTPQVAGGNAGAPALVASIGDIKIGRRMGYGPFAFLEHGIGQSYGTFGHGSSPSYSGGGDRADNELFLVPGPDPAAKWRAAYPAARVEVVGSPRLDDLPRRIPGPGPVAAISFHWPAPVSVSGYAGTAVGDFLPALPDLAKRFSVIGHQHPNWSQRRYSGMPANDYRKLGIPFVEDFDDVCRQADVFVADNTSCLYEFASTGRPVVLLNARQWSRKGPELGLRFWAASHVGINVDRAVDLVSAVERALEDLPEQQVAREDALSLVYGLRTNGAAAAATAIMDWLATKKEVAA